MQNKFLKKIKFEINRKGFCIIPNIFDDKKCKVSIDSIEKILFKRLKNKEHVGNLTTRWVYNYFLETPKLLNLVNNEKIDEIMKFLIDKDYTLIASNAQDGSINKKFKNAKDKITGGNWHQDSRFVGGKRLHKGFSFLLITALDDFEVDSAATQYIPYSHNKNYKLNSFRKYKSIIMKKGSICIMDSGLWHRRGIPNEKRRWGIFTLYGPWFMKPYFNYEKMMGKKFSNLSKQVKKILHFNSTPPISHKERIGTLKY